MKELSGKGSESDVKGTPRVISSAQVVDLLKRSQAGPTVVILSSIDARLALVVQQLERVNAYLEGVSNDGKSDKS